MGKVSLIQMKKMLLHPLFLLGVSIRLVLIFAMAPLATGEWYVPFLDASISKFTLDPWSEWLSAGGTSVAFPYGYAMWVAFLPLSLAAKLIGLPLLFGYALTLLAADLLLLFGLKQMHPGRDRLLLIAYWLSPIVILASYGFGFNDLIPVLLMAASLYFMQKLQLKLAGAVFFASISAKLSMVLALPFFLIYLINNRSIRQLLPQFIIGFLISGAVLGLPFLFSGSGLQMLFSNPEMGKVYRLALNLGGNLVVYWVPLIYLVLLYMVWRVRRLNFDLFNATLGISFLLIVLLTPASPGWFIWTIPFLISYQAMSGRTAIVLTGFFSGLYALSTLLSTPLRFLRLGDFDLVNAIHLSEKLSSHSVSLLHTTMIATGLILVLRIWRETVSRNDYFRLSRKPFVIGVAGDSGAGKDTFSNAIKDLFGEHSVVTLSGDDYHLWDRQKPMWQVMTHLNPSANDLEAFSRDLIALTDGKSIQSQNYDHESGKMGKPFNVNSNDFVIASGLHALYMPALRSCYNLGIYLDIDEGLRRYFKLQRDVHKRGHTVEHVLSSFEKREPDSARFIRPQAAHADLVFSLQPIRTIVVGSLHDKHPLRLKLVVRTRQGLNELSLNRVLIGVCGLHVDMTSNDNFPEVALTIEGETSAEDISMAAQMLCPRILEFLDIQPKWQAGVIGLMQLITLYHINQAMTKRFFQ